MRTICTHLLVASSLAAGCSPQQFLHFLPRQRFGEGGFVAEDGFDRVAFLLLQFQDLLLDGVAGDQLVAGYSRAAPIVEAPSGRHVIAQGKAQRRPG